MNILPCPFCGSHEVSISHSVDLDDVPASRYVECHKCAAMGPETKPYAGNAVKKWNGRAELDQLHRQLEESQKELGEARAQRDAQGMFGVLGGRCMKRIFEAADMSLPDSTDALLSLERIIRARDAATTEADRLRGALIAMMQTARIHGASDAEIAIGEAALTPNPTGKD